MRRILYIMVSVLLAVSSLIAAPLVQKAGQGRSIVRKTIELPARPLQKKSAKSTNSLPGSLRNASTLAASQTQLPEMYGTVIYANGWGQSTAGLGVYAAPRQEGERSTLEFRVEGMQGGVVVDGVYYISMLYEVVGCPYAKAFAYDVATGAKVFERDVNPMEVSASATVDPTTGQVYAINYNATADQHRLVKMNLSNTSWTSEEICSLSGSWNSISCDASGQLWGVHRLGTVAPDGTMNCTGAELCKISKDNGNYVVVGELGVVPKFQTDAEFDPLSGVLYTTVSDDESGYLATINTATGAATKVMTFPAGEEYVGIYFAAPGRPNAPTDLTAEISQSTLSGVIKFVAPTADNQGNAEGQLNYTISDNGSPLASGICAYADTVSVNVTVAEGKHLFGVRVANEKGISKAAYVEKVITYTPDVVITLPYDNTLEGNNPIDGWAFIDANSDNVTWGLYNDWSTENHSLRVGSSAGANLDDWAVMPAMKLEPGKLYTFKCKAWSHKNNFVEKLEGFWGNAPTVEGLSHQLFAITEIKQTSGNAHEVSGEIIVDKAGYYYIGMHACSTSDKSFYLYLDDFSITAGANTKIPAAITGLTVTPDGTGKLKATIKGTLPSTDMGGNPLTQIDAVEIYRDDDQLVETVTEGLTPGAPFTYIDDSVLGGEHVYTVYALNSYGRSAAATGKAFVGYPLPAAVASATMVETSDRQLQVTWEPVTLDIYGLPLKSSAIRYNVYAVHGGKMDVVGRNLRDTQYSFTAPIAEGEQEFLKVIVKAETTAGEGEGALSNMLPIGTPLKGFKESFAGRTINTPLMEEIIAGKTGTWAVYGDDTGIYAQDGDNGFIAMMAEGAKESTALVTGKISLEGIDNPAFAFYTYSIIADGGEPDSNTIEVWAREHGMEEWTVVLPGDKTVYEYCGNRNDTWGRVIADLSAFEGKTIQIAIVPTTIMYASVPVDNIQTCSLVDHDVQAVDIKAPRKVIAGNKFNVDVKIMNNGIKHATDFTVDLYADGKVVASKTVARLDVGAYSTVSIPVEMHPLAEEAVTYHAVVRYEVDMQADNNTTCAITVTPKFQPHPFVTDLTATSDDNKSVTLKWNAPIIETGFAETVTEGFEEADPLAKEVEDWTFVDIDNAPIGGVRGYDWSGLKAGLDKAAFFVMDTANAKGPAETDLVPHSGTKMLCAIYRQDDKAVNDWAISPILSGNAQTISLYVRSFSSRYLETIELCYSLGGLAPTAFTAVKTVKPVPYGEWTKVEFEVPEGARYFAIHNCGTNNFMLMVDDVTFERGNYNDLLEIRGYNIWRNGNRINSTVIEEPIFTDNDIYNGGEYQVTVVYEDYGQSRGSNKVNIQSAGVENILSGVRIEASNGWIFIHGAEGKAISVSDIHGRIRHHAVGNTRIALEAGVYIVNVDGVATRIIVK